MRVKSKKPKYGRLSSESLFQEEVLLGQFNAIWNDELVTYSPEEIKEIREWVYTMAEIIFKVSKRTERKIISLNKQENDTQSDNLYQGEYRRAG
jgi:hypothetical protein